MARIFGVAFALLIWPVLALSLVIIGPFVWVYMILRHFFMYAAMMLLHAIANKELKASISVLEDSIIWYPERLRNLIILLRGMLSADPSATLKGFRDEGNFDQDADDEPSEQPAGDESIIDELLRSLRNILTWTWHRLVPATLVWVGIYFTLSTVGIDLLRVLGHLPPLLSVAVWAGAWLLIGIAGMAVTRLVRKILIIPFVVLMTALWAALGLIFWFPRIVVGALDATLISFVFIMAGGRSRDPVRRLTQAFLYYMDGFAIIISVLTNPSLEGDAVSKEVAREEMTKVLRGLRTSFVYLLIYIPVGLAIWWFGFAR